MPITPLFAAVVELQAGSPGYAIGWGTLSLINAGLAQTKGKSGLFWWAVSLLLGPIATFLIVAFLEPAPLGPAFPPPPPPHPYGDPTRKPAPLDF